ncbi:MAG TPA: hypothetical protein VN046_11825 [Stenotrophobium sp.]|nr:hypothetical protein [Stenotrophobium sp.]
MTEPPLLMPRRLAIQILHEAQIAQPQAIRGVVLARDRQPAAFRLGEAEVPSQELWARCWSHPQAPAVPQASELHAGGLHLLISLNTKGVLEMRAWELREGQPHERILKVKD